MVVMWRLPHGVHCFKSHSDFHPGSSKPLLWSWFFQISPWRQQTSNLNDILGGLLEKITQFFGVLVAFLHIVWATCTPDQRKFDFLTFFVTSTYSQKNFVWTEMFGINQKDLSPPPPSLPRLPLHTLISFSHFGFLELKPPISVTRHRVWERSVSMEDAPSLWCSREA